MKIEGSFRFDAPRQEVWESLLDPKVLAQVMPGCEKLDQVGDNAYEGLLNIKVGPVQGKFKGKVTLSDIDAPNGYSMEVDGRGAPGFVKATAQVKLEDDGDGTKMSYDSEARVGGKIASVGQRLLDSSAKSIIKQSLEGLNHIIQGEEEEEDDGDDESSSSTSSASESSGSSKPKAKKAYRPPSQTELAVNVAKDVIDDLVPRPVQIGIVAGLVLFVLLLLFGRRR